MDGRKQGGRKGRRKRPKEHEIKSIEPGSIAEEMGLAPGDVLLSVNGTEVGDVFDYHYLTHDEYLTVLVRKEDGEEWELEIEKDYDEDLGIGFAAGLMDDYKSCRNKCIFCFIDQMPKGMRDTLYFKDDDARLSFLQGNYVTLTNMAEKDVSRIITYRMEPINISVQTTDPALRCRMLNNRFAGESLKLLDRFYEAGIEMNAQIVLCRGVNDGAQLERSIRDLTRYLPYMRSVSVVPVGLTKYREGLYPLEPFTGEDAREVLATIRRWQRACMESHGTHFVHASDEWYLLAGEELPGEESYDGYLQLENGVGMLRLLMDEFHEALSGAVSAAGRAPMDRTACPGIGGGGRDAGGRRNRTVPMPGLMSAEGSDEEGGRMNGRKAPCGEEVAACALREPRTWAMPDAGLAASSAGALRELPVHTVSIATGILAAPTIRQLAGECMEAFPDRRILVYPIRNDYFGELITVSGLLTGRDLAAQLTGRELGERLLLPCSMLRSGEEVFLDDMTLIELKTALHSEIDIVKSSGQDLLDAMLRP